MKNIKTFSERLRELNDHLSQRMLKSTFPTDTSLALFQSGEYYEKTQKINHAVYAYHQYVNNYPNAANLQDVKKKLEELQPRATVDRPFYPESTMIQTYPKDCLLFAEGEKGNNLYIIQSGSTSNQCQRSL